jgi:hypothetical protein
MKIDKAYCEQLAARHSTAADACLAAYDDAQQLIDAMGRPYTVVLLRHRLRNAFRAFLVPWPWSKPGRKLTQT